MHAPHTIVHHHRPGHENYLPGRKTFSHAGKSSDLLLFVCTPCGVMTERAKCPKNEMKSTQIARDYLGTPVP